MQSVQTSRVVMLFALIVVISSPVSTQPLNHPFPRQLQPQQHHPLMQRARPATLLPQDWKKRAAVEDLLSQLSLPGGDITQREAEVVSVGTEEGETVAMVTEEEGGVAKEDLNKREDAPNSLPPRERKAGCKNFYWKGFTSC